MSHNDELLASILESWTGTAPAADATADANRTAAIGQLKTRTSTAAATVDALDAAGIVVAAQLQAYLLGAKASTLDQLKTTTLDEQKASAVKHVAEKTGKDVAALEALPADHLALLANFPVVYEVKSAADLVRKVSGELAAITEEGEPKAAKSKELAAALAAYKTVVGSLQGAADIRREDAFDAAANAKSIEQHNANSAATKKELEQVEADLQRASKASIRSIPGKAVFNFFADRATVKAELTVLNGVLKDVVDARTTKFHAVAQAVDENWQARADKLTEAVNNVKASSQALQNNVAAVATDAELAVEDVTALETNYLQLKDPLHSKAEAEKNRRTTFDQQFTEFDDQRKRLLVWCRQQKANLDSLVNVDDLQEFCASILSNFATMEENYVTLLELSESLEASPKVQAALLEANEVWLNLQVSAYERLRHTLIEVHSKSKLEDEVRAFAGFTENATRFLLDFEKLLSHPTDADSKSLVGPVVEQCRNLIADFDQAGHEEVAPKLRDFALRMESLRENYNHFRRGVLGRITFLSGALPSIATSYRRKEEYAQRMGELKQWIQVKSKGETWAEIRARISQLKELVVAEKDALAAKKEEQQQQAAAAAPPAKA